MKKLLTILMFLSLAWGLGACAETEPPMDSGKTCIVTTVFPAYDFARQIAGDCADVRLLVPPGAETHSFEPTAKDILTLQSCDLLICNGGESEAWLEEITEGLEGSVNRLSMLACVDALEEEAKEGMQGVHEHDHEDHDGHEGHEDGDHEEHEEGPEYDEHVWTSPVNASLICRAICAELCAVDGANADIYQANLEAYCSELEKLDGAFRQTVSAGKRDTLIFADRFPVRYFTEEYGLDYYAAFLGCADDAEPSAKTVAFLIDRVRETDIPAVFYIEFSNQKMADVICEDTGCRKLLFHSCHNVSVEELENGVSYLEMMWANLEAVKEALG